MDTLERLVPTEVLPVEYGPLHESTRISSGLDYYKPTMSQLAFEVEPDAEVTFTFHNRGQQRLMDFVEPTDLQQRFDQLRSNGFSDDELSYFSGLKDSANNNIFSQAYIDYIKNNELPPVEVSYDDRQDDIAVETSGPWALASFWETVVMSEINEAYFENYLGSMNIDPSEVYDEGDRRLSEKIALLKEHPDIKFSDFGTRRHFSLRWHKYVLERLVSECPENFLGTSNVELSHTLGKKPIGTFAHELPMVFAALADARGENIRGSHKALLDAWYTRYGYDSSTALTDTFGTDFFFEDFTKEQAINWKGLRHDSGDPIEFGEKTLTFYEQNDIDPLTKTIVFSDGLNINQILLIHEYFKGRINVMFGWGTTLDNDLGIDPLNIVMKATHVVDKKTGAEADTVKLSDSDSKHTGPIALVGLYKKIYFNAGETRV
jgi:nicotinate phosphoribosyltransferase